MLWMWLLACGGADKTPADTAPAGRCPADTLAAGTVEVFATGFETDGRAGTEGLTFGPDGRLYVGGSSVGAGGFVAEVQPDGTWARLADVDVAVGLAWHRDRLLVATGDVGDGTGGLVAVDPDAGTTAVVASGIDGANFPVVTPWGSVLVSSPGNWTIHEVTDGGVTLWSDAVPSPNGLAFAPDGATLYAANTYATPSTVAAVPVVDRAAGAPAVLATLPDGSTQDGVAMDADGNLYVVNNLPGTIARISPDGDVHTVAEGVDFGASLAFGEGPFDPCSLYVSSLFGPHVFRVGVGAPGAPPHR